MTFSSTQTHLPTQTQQWLIFRVVIT